MREISSISNTESSPLQLGASSHNLTHDNTHQESMKMSNDQFLPIQFSLSVGAVDDPLEHEADAVADKVMRMPETPFIQRCACEEEKINRKHISSTITPFIQTKSSGAGVASESVSAQINSSRGSGNGMDTGTRSFMENRFGADFGNVSIHSDQKSVQMNRELNAQAFTVGNDIYFNSGKYSPQSDSGKHLLAHELTHVVQQNSGNTHINRQFIQRTPAQAAANQICYSTSAPPPTPSAREPELHPTYELWLESFTGMSTFRSNDTIIGQTALNQFDVLGSRGARFNETGVDSDSDFVEAIGSIQGGEEFIDHPTNEWVQNCLPSNLRTIAYQLPSDCADIAIILRHVWLAAHHRTESYSNWTIGDAAGASAHRRMRTVIGSVFSGNVSRMVQPYADDSGATLKDFDLIAPILHEGDVLVWEHRETISKRGKPSSSKRTGGHTQTINRILRTGGNITGIQTLQGNQPIFSDAAEQILLSQRRRNTSPDSSEGERLRALPSRRLESDEAISISNINHPVTQTKIWGAIDNPSNDKNEIEFTILVAVGPPKTATRPASRTARSILNWNRIISSARLNNITGLLEAILLEARSMAESGGATGNATANDMTTLGTSFGSRLKYLNRRDASQFANSKINFINIIDAIRSEANNSTAVAPLFDAFKIAFEDATK